jgi:anti-anti-sigma factor
MELQTVSTTSACRFGSSIVVDDRPLRVSVEAAWLVRLAGRLDASTVAQLEDVIDRPGYVVVDCSDLTFMDPAGVAVLIDAVLARRRDGGAFAVTGLSAGPLRVAQQSGLEDLLNGRDSP